MPGFHHVSCHAFLTWRLDLIIAHVLNPNAERIPGKELDGKSDWVYRQRHCQWQVLDVIRLRCTPRLTSRVPRHETEYMIVDEEDLVTVPSHMTYEEGATLPIACGTAWTALYGAGKILKSGDTVVCMGTGGVAVFTAAVREKPFKVGGSLLIEPSSPI